METALKQDMQKAIYEVTRLALELYKMLLTYAVNRVILQNINAICHKRAERGEYDAKAQKVPKGVPDAADKGISSFGQSLR